MKHNDYFPIGSCKLCGKPVLTPRAWIGLNKDGSYKDTPKYKTCKCER